MVVVGHFEIIKKTAIFGLFSFINRLFRAFYDCICFRIIVLLPINNFHYFDFSER